MAKQLLLYVEGNRAIFYGGDLTEMKQMDFPVDIVRDLDVINKDKLYVLIQALIEAYQLIPTAVTIALSSLVTFDRDLSQVAPEKQKEEEQKFLDQVPFQNILPYRFSQQNKMKIIAANKDFTYAIKTGLEKRGFTVPAVVPLAALQEVLPELATNLNLDLILSKIDSIKQFNMLVNQEPLHTITPQQKAQGKPSNKRVFLLAGVFGVLLIILIIVAVINLAPSKPAQPPVLRPTTQSTSPPSQTLSQEHSGSQSAFVQSSSQSVQGISTYRRIIPTFYKITTGGR